MPQSRPKPSEIAAEAKKTYIPYIERAMRQYPARSILYPDSSLMRVKGSTRPSQRLRVAVIDGDPVDVALDWYRHNTKDGLPSPPTSQIPVVNMANEKRAGGDWESGLMAPEECLARRSNLVHTLVTPWDYSNATPHYPMPQRGGIYSPHVVVYRDGPDHYELWRDFRPLPVISVAPVRRPKLDESGTQYSFVQEKGLMMEKMRTILRIAAYAGHKDICLGAFGVGPIFRNPVAEVARMWRILLFHEEEFKGVFSNVVFAIESNQPGNSKGGASDFEVFREEFSPSKIFPTTWR
ncbi:hypothetical protein W97_08171 [Coniosporium apollinis CBS 100218]|uniref:Microbial-type PARG catalytic domain-containing protein n=1 Tax=Coniosporium apollinis (strain CBS 100218) TaxID=1168221 RepID=R7Z483_CONA1|nr:uncharacterized protein W97_08171 [Coniosporium apollinis CBS 100218]EON68913.1 hypothetical protein W97_08171 [Coniosporium apollinis CBS 100218]